MKELWPDFGYYPSIFMIRLRKTMENHRIVSVAAKIQTRRFININKKLYCLNQHPRYKHCENIERMDENLKHITRKILNLIIAYRDIILMGAMSLLCQFLEADKGIIQILGRTDHLLSTDTTRTTKETRLLQQFFFVAGTSLSSYYLATIGGYRDRLTDTHVQQFFYCCMSESELLYDGRFTTNQFVLATSPLTPTTSNFIFQLNNCGMTSSLARGCVCRLQLLLVLASAVILRSEPRGLVTTFYCLRFETLPTWRIRSP
jgi:hypothetical protein